MPPTPEHPHPPRLIDTDRIAHAAAPVIAWFDWYATGPARTIDADAIRRLFAADHHLQPLAALGGPVGTAIHIILDGGIGHSTATMLNALDTLAAFVHPDRPPADAPWHRNPHPLRQAAPRPAFTPTLPGFE